MREKIKNNVCFSWLHVERAVLHQIVQCMWPHLNSSHLSVARSTHHFLPPHQVSHKTHTPCPTTLLLLSSSIHANCFQMIFRVCARRMRKLTFNWYFCRKIVVHGFSSISVSPWWLDYPHPPSAQQRSWSFIHFEMDRPIFTVRLSRGLGKVAAVLHRIGTRSKFQFSERSAVVGTRDVIDWSFFYLNGRHTFSIVNVSVDFYVIPISLLSMVINNAIKVPLSLANESNKYKKYI